MLTPKEWAEFHSLIDGEYMTQVDDAGFQAALMGVKLAIALARQEDVSELLLEYLGTFANWQKENLGLPQDVRRKLYVNNYGEEEVQAMEEMGEIRFQETEK